MVILSIVIILAALYYMGRVIIEYNSYNKMLELYNIELGYKKEINLFINYLVKLSISVVIIGSTITLNLNVLLYKAFFFPEDKLNMILVKILNYACVIAIIIEVILMILYKNFDMHRFGVFLNAFQSIIIAYPSCYFLIRLLSLVPNKKKDE